MFGIVPSDMAEELVQDGENLVRLQCLPLYSLLLALDNPTVNVLSLDIEGAEFQVIERLSVRLFERFSELIDDSLND